MTISGYGVSYNYSGYGTSANKTKTSSVITANPAEKPKTESKNGDTAKTSSVSLPSGIDTKTELTRDEELLIAMAELGKKHAQQGTFHEADEEFIALMKEYMPPPSKESVLPGGLFCLSTYEEVERSREIIAAYNAGYDFTTGRYSPPQDPEDIKKESFSFVPTSFAKSREIYNSIYDSFRNNVIV